MKLWTFRLPAVAMATVATLTACSGSQPFATRIAQTANALDDPNAAKVILVGTGWKGPGQIAVDEKGDVYVVDALTKIMEVSPPFRGRTHGKIRTVVSGYPFSPLGVAVDSHENVYFSQDEALDYVEQITPKGVQNLVYRGAGEGYVALAVDANENVYAAGFSGGTPGTAQAYFIGHRAKGGWKNPVRIGPTFYGYQPGGIAVDLQRNVYLSLFSPNGPVRKIEPSGKIVTVGSGFDGTQEVAISLACKAACSVYVADSGNNAIKKISPPFDGQTHGKITEIGYGFLGPLGVAARNGDAYVADTGNVQVKEVVP